MLKHNNNSILTVNDTKRSSSILFQNEIRSKTIFLELTRKSSKKRVPKLIRYLVGVQISRLHFAKYVGNLLELGSAPLRYYSSVEA